MASLLRPALVAVALAVAATGCSSDGGSDGTPTGGDRTRAIEQLRDLGLTKAQSNCMVDELGAATVAEATDVGALTRGEPYRAAAARCLEDG